MLHFLVKKMFTAHTLTVSVEGFALASRFVMKLTVSRSMMVDVLVL